MTDAQKAHKYAKAMMWAENNRERCRAIARAWYAKNKLKANNASWRYDQEHYQERLAYWRERSRRHNDEKRVVSYKPRMSVRVPEYAESAAHARFMRADVRSMSVREAFAHGVLTK